MYIYIMCFKRVTTLKEEVTPWGWKLSHGGGWQSQRLGRWLGGRGLGVILVDASGVGQPPGGWGQGWIRNGKLLSIFQPADRTQLPGLWGKGQGRTGGLFGDYGGAGVGSDWVWNG